MRKKFFNGKRVLALTLALSLVIGEASIAVAAPAEETGEAAVVEVVETEEAADDVLAEETVSANEAADGQGDAQDAETEEPVAEEAEAEEPETDDELAAEEAANGTLSQVIGLKAEASYSTLTDDNGKVVGSYVSTYAGQQVVYVKGKLAKDEQTGWVTYNGKTYTGSSYDELTDQTTLYPNNEIQIVPGTDSSAYRDAATGFYNVNGVTYRWLNSKSVNGTTVLYCYPSEAVSVVTVTDSSDRTPIKKAYGRYTKTLAYYDETATDPEQIYQYSPAYYEVNGVTYDYINRSSYYTGNGYKYVWYVTESDMISLTKQKVKLSWNWLTNPNKYLDKYEPNSFVYYEIKVNGQDYTYDMSAPAYDASGVAHYYTAGSDWTFGDITLNPGESIKVQVRGLYAHRVYKQVTKEDGTIASGDITVIDSAGPWSEEFTYTAAAKTAVPAVASVTATKKGGINNSILLKWNTVPQADSYDVYEVHSKKPIAMTAAEFKQYYDEDYDFLTAKGLTSADLYTTNRSASLPESDVTYDSQYLYHYYAVVPNGVADSEKYYNDNTLKTITTFGALQTAEEPQLYTPALTNFKVEKQSDGSFDLVWDKVDADVVIYAYDQSAFPNLYQYKYFYRNVRRVLYSVDENGNVINDAEGKPVVYDDISLKNDIDSSAYYDNALKDWVYNISKDYVAYNKVVARTTSGSNGRYDNVISNMGLTAGKTYYFVAYTYDADEEYAYGTNSNAKAPITYSYTGRYKDQNNVQQTTTINAAYTYYPTLGPATNVVSLKAKLTKPYVDTLSAKNSVKLTMSNGLGTGYEIYRKVGKKYKKIATTTSNFYLDEGLKANTSYSYKIRSYSYNRDTKQTYYSEYRTVTAKTIAAEDLSLHAVKASKTSVKLKWTKVSNATKYEIYRTDLRNEDSTVVSKKYSAAGFKTYLSSTSYKLVKTIGKAKTTSYTDKKLTSGDSYSYMVVAYFKDGKTTQILKAEDYVTLDLERPQNVQAVNKGNKVVITWDADKYAAGYEVEYYVNDKYGKKTTTEPTKQTTKKATLTISGLEAGGNVTFRVRAYNKSKEYSDWNDYYYDSSSKVPLAPVKGITAKTVTTKDGKQIVKISWKKVAGAKYYKVYRSTTMGTYDADAKLYDIVGTSIVKESNDNFYTSDSISSRSKGSREYDTVSYKEYEGVSGSIVGTSAYDYADLAGGVTYYYTVEAYGEIPSGGSSSYVYSVQCSKPAAVTAKSSLNVTATSKKGKVTLKWTKIEGASGVKYTVYRATSAKGKYTKLGTTSKTTFTDKKSKKGKTYYYKVEVTSGKSALKSDISVTSPAKKVKAK